MAFLNPSDSTEVLYGASGDVRDELNSHASVASGGHYFDESEIPGSLIVRGLRKATRLIDGFLEVTYADKLPFTAVADVPRILDEIATDIATFYTLRSSVANVGPLSDNKKRDYFDVYVNSEDGILTKMSKREIQIPELTASYADDSALSQKTDRIAIFDVDEITSHEVDPDLLDDIADDRK